MLFTPIAILALSSVVAAYPAGLQPALVSRDNSLPTASVSQDIISSQLTRPALHARAAYCSAGSVTSLSCGDPCQAVSDITVLTAGGDDGLIPGCEFVPLT